MTDLSDRTIVVTGAAGGLGTGVCLALRDAGARVVALDVSGEALAGAFAEAARIEARVVDLLDADALARVRDGVLEAFPDISGLVNLAGGFSMGDPVHELPATTWARMHDLNVRTLLAAVGAFTPRIRAHRGAIVNVGARGAVQGSAGMGAYAATKSAVHRLTEAMADELRGEGVNVNAVLPSVIDTPANRRDMPDADFDAWVRPASLAGVIAFLLSDAARDVHGALVPVVARS